MVKLSIDLLSNDIVDVLLDNYQNLQRIRITNSLF